MAGAAAGPAPPSAGGAPPKGARGAAPGRGDTVRAGGVGRGGNGLGSAARDGGKPPHPLVAEPGPFQPARPGGPVPPGPSQAIGAPPGAGPEARPLPGFELSFPYAFPLFSLCFPYVLPMLSL